jgi:hypothetical protein
VSLLSLSFSLYSRTTIGITFCETFGKFICSLVIVECVISEESIDIEDSELSDKIILLE